MSIVTSSIPQPLVILCTLSSTIEFLPSLAWLITYPIFHLLWNVHFLSKLKESEFLPKVLLTFLTVIIFLNPVTFKAHNLYAPNLSRPHLYTNPNQHHLSFCLPAYPPHLPIFSPPAGDETTGPNDGTVQRFLSYSPRQRMRQPRRRCRWWRRYQRRRRWLRRRRWYDVLGDNDKIDYD